VARQKENVSGTKDRIISTSISHFSDFGLKGARMRDIVDDAGVNVAAINYHFGSKSILFGTLVDETFEKVKRHRLAYLDEARSTGPLTLDTIIKAIVYPIYEVAQEPDGLDLIRLLNRLEFDSDEEVIRIYKKKVRPHARRIIQELQEALPNHKRKTIVRIYALVANTVQIIGGQRARFRLLAERGEKFANRDMADMLVAFCVAGAEAVLADQP